MIDAAVVQRGCELQLFVPTKVGNLECTFCFDCVQACPYDNVALAARVPGEELTDDTRRSLIGRLSKRPDLAALVLVFTFGALRQRVRDDRSGPRDRGVAGLDARHPH